MNATRAVRLRIVGGADRPRMIQSDVERLSNPRLNPTVARRVVSLLLRTPSAADRYQLLVRSGIADGEARRMLVKFGLC